MEKLYEYEYADLINKRLQINIFDYLVKVDEVDKNSINDVDNERFDFFTNLLKKFFSNYDYHNLVRNIRTIILKNGKTEYSKEDKVKLERGSCEGFYFPNSNSIVIKKKDDYNSVIHELFHLSSSSNINLVGFHQNTDYTIDYNFCGEEQSTFLYLGIGINEGTTEMLTEDVLGKGTVYFNERRIARLIRLIVGDELFIQSYFNSDLYSLVNELLKYSNKDDVNNLINYSDILLKYLPGKISRTYHSEELYFTQKLYYTVTNILYKMLKRKLMNFDLDTRVAYLKEFVRICELKPEKKKWGESPFKMIYPKLYEIINSDINELNVVK